MPQRREYVASLYRDVLGREGSEGEIEGHLGNPGSEEDLRNFFLGSPEYTSRHGGTQTWQNDASGNVVPYSTTPPSAPPDPSAPAPGWPENVPTAPPPPISPTFTPGRHDYSAFNTGRAQDPSKSAKDAFAGLSSNAPPPPLHDRNAMRAWFEQHIAPGMNSLGHRVIRVDDNGFEYENHEGRFYVDYAQNLGAAAGTRDQRLQWNATPSDEATRRRYSTTPAASGGGGGGSATQRTASNIGNLYSQLGLQYGGPGGPGVFNGPLQQVGQDPLSQLITGGLADLILNQGMTRSGQGVMDSLNRLIASGGRVAGRRTGSGGGGGGGASFAPTGPVGGDVNYALGGPAGAGGEVGAGEDEGGGADIAPSWLSRFESARELMAKGERTANEDARAALASRGLLSEGGRANVSGAEAGTLGRVQMRNAEEFARALRDIGIAEDDNASSRLTSALGLATGMATDQARTLLATLGAGSDRQNMLAQIALESLQTNMAWNQFLAQFGLERDKAMYAIQNGQIDQIMPYLSLFLQLAQGTQRGYV